MNRTSDPHAGGRLFTLGPPSDRAKAVVLAVHGRGATADSILALAEPVGLPEVLWAAPAAEGNSWYPHSFLEKIELNEPWLTSGLNLIKSVLAGLEAEGLPRRKVMLLGFSQGACLALEFAARNAGRYGAVVGLSGGLVGPPGTERGYGGWFEDTPLFIGCSDTDPHIPLARLRETEEVFQRLGAEVTLQLYPGSSHGVNADELERVRILLKSLTG